MCVFSAPVLHIGVLKYSPTSWACAAIFFSRKIPLNFLDPSIWFDKICLCPPMNYTLLFSSGYCAKKYQLKGSFIWPALALNTSKSSCFSPPRHIYFHVTVFCGDFSSSVWFSVGQYKFGSSKSTNICPHTMWKISGKAIQKTFKVNLSPDTMLKKEPFFQIKFPFSMLPLSKGVENSYYEPFFESFVFINWKRVYLKSQN